MELASPKLVYDLFPPAGKGVAKLVAQMGVVRKHLQYALVLLDVGLPDEADLAFLAQVEAKGGYLLPFVLVAAVPGAGFHDGCWPRTHHLAVFVDESLMSSALVCWAAPEAQIPAIRGEEADPMLLVWAFLKDVATVSNSHLYAPL